MKEKVKLAWNVEVISRSPLHSIATGRDSRLLQSSRVRRQLQITSIHTRRFTRNNDKKIVKNVATKIQKRTHFS